MRTNKALLAQAMGYALDAVADKLTTPPAPVTQKITLTQQRKQQAMAARTKKKGR